MQLKVLKQDKTIIEQVISKGKGMIIIVNKWDLVTKNTSTMSKFEREIKYQLKALNNYPLLFISALTKQRIHRVFEISWEIYQRGKQNYQQED